MTGIKLIGNYEITERVLGKGSSGEVRLGRHLLSGLHVAVKILDISTMEPEALERLEREMYLLEEIKDLPSVSHLLDSLTDEFHIYLIYELLQGQNLLDLMMTCGQFRLEEDVARATFLQLVRIVQSCHEREICHLDIKLENVVYDFVKQSLILIDFEFGSRFRKREPVSVKNRSGSPQYCAPEIYYSTDDYDGTRADVWSLGVLLYVLVSGEFPFADDTGGEVDIERIFQKKISSDFNLPSDVFSPHLADLLRSIFQVDPRNRPSTENLLLHPWLLSPSSSSQQSLYKSVA